MALRRWMLPAVVALALGAALPARAQTGSAAPVDDGPVRVYTNADLDRLWPVPEPSAAPVVEDLGWDFVTEFLDRQHALLDADRRHELSERLVAVEEEAVSRANRRAPHLGLYWGVPFVQAAYGRHAVRPARVTHGPTDRIAPLHAGPTPAERHRGRAIRNSGADAVPQRPAN